MKISLDLNKSVEENAASYFEAAKKAKKKMEGAAKALELSKKKLEKLKDSKPEVEKVEKKVQRKKHWYEKFRWFISSEGFLIIGGRDATTNEIIIKKHAQEGDIVFHTDMAGSPFVVVKADGKDIGEKTLQEAADFTATFSKAWKLGMGNVEVFHVKPEQVTKEAQAGEYLQKGSFMIRGTTTYIQPRMNFAVGNYKESIMGGPVEAVKKHCKDYVEIVQGDSKISDIAKKIKKTIGGDLDEIIRTLPPNSAIK